MSEERWYEFTEITSFSRPVYVRARSLKEARASRYTPDVVPDYIPSHPDGFRIIGRGRLVADQSYVDDLVEERCPHA